MNNTNLKRLILPMVVLNISMKLFFPLIVLIRKTDLEKNTEDILVKIFFGSDIATFFISLYFQLVLHIKSFLLKAYILSVVFYFIIIAIIFFFAAGISSVKFG